MNPQNIDAFQKRFNLSRLENLSQTRYLSKINQLKAAQREVEFWAAKKDEYKKAVDAFKHYIDLLKEFNSPKALINAYIKMGQYCESMGDRLLAQDTYRMALEVEQKLGLDPQYINKLRAKIDSLSWY